ncbi:MAG TPA: NAD-dependent epimerase/dehydratase family protein [Candidatus Limnocylindria bacterium]|nr:NAD-dependent epimerase/dehydratase family protein [Candidatus Limnocylindria bacterium]
MTGGALDVLLIGGSGFMGRHVTEALQKAGHRVSVLSRGLRPPPAGVETLVADRNEPEALARALNGRRFDFTVDFMVYDAVDIERLLLVPYAALGRYAMISTGQVYLVTAGAEPPYREEDTDADVRPEPGPGTTDHGQWQYGAGKRRAERTLSALRATHGVRAVALRLPIMQGEGDGSLRLWAYLERLLDGAPLLLPEDGAQLVRHLDVADLAAMIVRLAEAEAPRAYAYNLTQAEVLTLREMLERVAAAAGVTPRFVNVGWDELHAAGLDGSVSPFSGRWRSVLDPSRAAAEWGFIGTRTEEYLPRVVRWHLENRPAQSHHGYANRPRELELMARLGAATR